MAKKWTDYTRREKTIGILAGAFALFTIGGIANATNPEPSAIENTAPAITEMVEPAITFEEVTETEAIEFKSTTQNDPTLDEGTRRVTTVGVDGVRTLTYKVTLTDGIETDRGVIDSVVTKEPTTEITSIGTYVAPVAPAAPAAASGCDPNYTDGCVPIASDVDCGGGSGNGPAYLYGTARVIGSDIYDLDGDNDGIACE